MRGYDFDTGTLPVAVLGAPPCDVHRLGSGHAVTPAAHGRRQAQSRACAGTRMIGTSDLAVYLSKFDRKYWLTYKVLDILQKVRPALPPSPATA